MGNKMIETSVEILQAKVNEIVEKRSSNVPSKKLTAKSLKWLSKEKKDYTDQAIHAVSELCKQIPTIVDKYAKSSNKVWFALTNARLLMRVKKNLDKLDTSTWVPKIVDQDTYKLAEAYGEFIKNIYENHEETLGFLKCSRPDELKYEVVNKLPSKPDASTIYIQKDGYKINYCYRAESDPNSIINGEMSETLLGGHKNHYTKPDYFKKNLYRTDNKLAFGKSIAPLLYEHTKYHKHNAHEPTLKILYDMTMDIDRNIHEYDKNKSSKKEIKGKQ